MFNQYKDTEFELDKLESKKIQLFREYSELVKSKSLKKNN